MPGYSDYAWSALPDTLRQQIYTQLGGCTGIPTTLRPNDILAELAIRITGGGLDAEPQ